MNLDAERVAGYVLQQLQARHPDQRRLQSLRHLNELPPNFSFKGVPGDSRDGWIGWLDGRYPLILLDHIPTPEDMLEIQCIGQRYVSLLNEQMPFPIGRHADALAFLLHDLEHAHKFFGNPESHRGQLHFFRKVRESLKHRFFQQELKDPQFEREFHYLISDMNSHPVHLLKYLKAIVLNAHIRAQGNPNPDLSYYWGQLFTFWNMSQNETMSAFKINTPGEESSDAQKAVAEFFIRPMPEPPSAALLERLCQ